MRAMIGALALWLAATGPTFGQSRDELAKLAQKSVARDFASWRTCLQDQLTADRGGAGGPEALASAALASCSEWEDHLRAIYAYALALSANETPLKTAAELASERAAGSFAIIRSNEQVKLIEQIRTRQTAR